MSSAFRTPAPVPCHARFQVPDPAEAGRRLAALPGLSRVPAVGTPPDRPQPKRFAWCVSMPSRRWTLGELELDQDEAGTRLSYQAPDEELFRIGLALLECAATGFIHLQHVTVGEPRTATPRCSRAAPGPRPASG